MFKVRAGPVCCFSRAAYLVHPCEVMMMTMTVTVIMRILLMMMITMMSTRAWELSRQACSDEHHC